MIQLVERVLQGDRRIAGRTVFVDHSDVELPVRVGVVVAAIFRKGLGQFNTHITLVRRDLRRERSDAEVAALFEDLHHVGAVHHLRGIHILQRTKAHTRIAFGIQLTTEEGNLLRLEAPGLILKTVVGKVLERSLTAAQHQVDIGFQVSGFQTVEPFGIQVSALVAREAHHLRQVHLDFQTVGFHSLHTEVLCDGVGTHLEASGPQTRFVRYVGLHVEAIDVVDRLGIHLLGIETTVGINHFKDDGVVIRNRRFHVVEHEVELQFVARTPHATVGVGESCHAFLDGLTRNVETAVRQSVAVIQLNHRLALPIGSHHKGGTVGALQLHMALAIDSAFAEFLALVVVGCHLGTRSGLGIGDVEDEDVHQVVATHLGRHSEVADDDVLLFLHIVIIIVAVGVAVFAIVAVFLVVVGFAVPVIGFLFIVVVSQSKLHLVASEGVVSRTEVEAQLIHGTRLHLDVIGEHDGERLPLVRIRIVNSQTHLLLQTASLTDAVGFGQIVVLQEREDVVVEDTNDSQRHTIEADGVEIDSRLIHIGNDDAFVGPTHLRLHLGEVEGILIIFLEHHAIGRADATVHANPQLVQLIPIDIALVEVEVHLVSLDVGLIA